MRVKEKGNILLFLGLDRNKRTDGVALRRLRAKEGLFLGENEEKGNNKTITTTIISAKNHHLMKIKIHFLPNTSHTLM